MREFIKDVQVPVFEVHNGIAEIIIMGLTGSFKGAEGLVVGAKVTAWYRFHVLLSRIHGEKTPGPNGSIRVFHCGLQSPNGSDSMKR